MTKEGLQHVPVQETCKSICEYVLLRPNMPKSLDNIQHVIMLIVFHSPLRVIQSSVAHHGAEAFLYDFLLNKNLVYVFVLILIS